MKTHLFDSTCNADITLILNNSHFKFSYLQTSRADATWPLYTTFPGISKCRSKGPHPPTSWRWGRWYPSLARVSCRWKDIREGNETSIFNTGKHTFYFNKSIPRCLFDNNFILHILILKPHPTAVPLSSLRNFFNIEHTVKCGGFKNLFIS